MKCRQKFDEARRRWVASVLGQIVHDQVRPALRQIVNTQVKNSSLERNAPLDGKRNLYRVRQLPQDAGSSDTVMIGKRHEAHQFKVDFNLTALQLEGQLGRQGRRPVGL